MEKTKVIDLEIIDDLEESGTQKISLVGEPAIEKDWMYFKREDFEISTGNLSPYTEQVGEEDKEEDGFPDFDYEAILKKAATLGFSASDLDDSGLLVTEDHEGIDLKLAQGYTVYKYQGSVSSNTRQFCRQMVNLNRFYTFEEINQLSAANPNPGFGLNGDANYSIWKYKGGPNCKHKWQKYYVNAEGKFQNKGPAVGTAGETPYSMPGRGYAMASESDQLQVGDAVSWQSSANQKQRGKIKEITYRDKTIPGTVTKIEGCSAEDPGYIIEIYQRENGSWKPSGKFVGLKSKEVVKNVELWRQSFSTVEDKREIIGPVAIPDKEILRLDENKNPYYVRFSKDLIRRMAEKFLRERRIDSTNVDHQEIDGGTYIFESWIVENENDKANEIYKLDVPIGTWMVKARVVNDSVWQGVKEGRFNGWSLEGSFVTKEEKEEYDKDRKLYQRILNLVEKF